jgi:alpha-L-arabinofuranosidase
LYGGDLIHADLTLDPRFVGGVINRRQIESPTIVTNAYGDVPMVDGIATHDSDQGATAVFLVNRSLSEAVTVEIDASRLAVSHVVSATTMHDADIHASNTLDAPDRVTPTPNDTARIENGSVSITLPAVSWTAVKLR